jgi:hypothetical protein
MRAQTKFGRIHSTGSDRILKKMPCQNSNIQSINQSNDHIVCSDVENTDISLEYCCSQGTINPHLENSNILN